ncbi:MAG: hypothetical protein WC707_03840 [Candidatus Babeliaceae bacterium]|jgi:hypothetical protein
METSLFTDQEYLLIREVSKISPRSLETWDLLEHTFAENKNKLSPRARKVLQQKLAEAIIRLKKGMSRPCFCAPYLWIYNVIKKSLSLLFVAAFICFLGGFLHYYIHSSLQEVGYITSFFVTQKYIDQQMSAVIFLYGLSAVVACLALIRGFLLGSRLTRRQVAKNQEITLYIQRIAAITL